MCIRVGGLCIKSQRYFVILILTILVYKVLGVYYFAVFSYDIGNTVHFLCGFYSKTIIYDCVYNKLTL